MKRKKYYTPDAAYDAARIIAALNDPRDEEIARLKEALKRMAGNIAASSSIVPSDAIPLIEIARAALNGEKE